MRKAKVINPPERIFLCVGDLEYEDAEFSDLREVTWCSEKIDESDVEYRLVKRSARAHRAAK